MFRWIIKNYNNSGFLPAILVGLLIGCLLLTSDTMAGTITGSGNLTTGSLPANTTLPWGSLTGTLSNQADLQDDLDAKEPTIATGNSTYVWYGDKSWAAIPESYGEGCRVYNNANISVPNTTWTIVTLNSERYDTDNIHSTVSDTTKLTCNTAGKYAVTAHADWASDTDGMRNIAIALNRAVFIAMQNNLPDPGGFCAHSIATVWDLDVSDYIELWVYHSAGNALNLNYTGGYSPEISMQRVGD